MVKDISVLIPVYNYDVSELVNSLHRQCQKELSGFEILLFDDGSSENFKLLNRNLSRLPNVIYRELPRNIGRSAIRNLLAREARFNTLIFLDNDSALPDDDFIGRYKMAASEETVISGGTLYSENQPPKTEMLRWVYGRQREQKTATERNRNPYHSLTLNNICLPKSVALRFPLDEQLRQYGHEDTAFGWALEQHQVPFQHIDNPVMHLGLESSEVFLKKTEQAILNLVHLYQHQPQIPATRLYSTYQRLKKSGFSGLFLKGFRLLEKTVRQNLLSARPSLFLFDLYKLYFFALGMDRPETKDPAR